MSDTERLLDQLAELHTIVRMQRLMRLGLRAVWLGAAGVMLGWGLNALWGWLPNPISWVLIGVALALVPLSMLLRSLSPQSHWVWTMDRRLGLNEQASTAWAVVQKKQRGVLSDSLVQDVSRTLPFVRTRILQRGWFIKRDLISTLIIALVGAVLLASGLIRPYSDLLNNPPAALQPLPDQPPVAQVPPEENPAQQPQPDPQQPGGPSEGSPQEGQQPGQEDQPSSGSDLGAVGEILRQMGAELSDQAGTHRLGEALQNEDMQGAADALDDLNNQLDELSPETRENLAEAMENAAEDLTKAGPPGEQLSEDMEEAAEALQQQSGEANQSLDDVAEDLRELGEQMDDSEQAGGGTGDQQGSGTGNPEPLTRLPNEGGEMDLPLDDSEPSDLLNPAPPDAEGTETAGGSQDSFSQPGDDTVQSPLLPNSFPWKWRDVVSQYFQR